MASVVCQAAIINLGVGTNSLPSISFGNPNTGFYGNGTTGIIITANGGNVGLINAAGIFTGAASSRGAILNVNASATAPTLAPNSTDGTTGFGAQASGNISAIVAGVENMRWTAAGHLYLGTIPTVSGTGTPTIATGSTNSAGEVTSGTSAVSVVITFAGAPLGNAPFCVVTPLTQLVAFAYTISTSAITVTQTATTGEKIEYACTQH